MIVIRYIQHEFIDAMAKCGTGNYLGSGTLIGFIAMSIEGQISIEYSPDISSMDAINIVKEQIQLAASKILT